MMSLLANMDLRDFKIENLAKANYGIEFIVPPSKDGGNSDGGNSDGGNLNRNVALALKMEAIQLKPMAIQQQETIQTSFTSIGMWL